MKIKICHVLVLSLIASQIAIGQTAATADHALFPLYLKVQLSPSVRFSSLKPGEATEGTLARDVYSADGKVFAAGSRVHLTVDHLERRRKAASDHWPWVVKVFMPRHENFPSFKNATVSASDGTPSPLQVSLVSVSRMTEVQPQRKKNRQAKNDTSLSDNTARERSKPADGPTMSLEARAVGTKRRPRVKCRQRCCLRTAS